MAKQYPSISDKHQQFIQQQKIFFVATATAEGRINLSPKGMDSLRIIHDNQVAWLNLTGSGNESSTHIQVDSRMTIMFCAFEGDPLILRLYGQAKVIHHNDSQWSELYGLFPDNPGARQIFVLDVEISQSSCGFGVPFFDYQGERETLNDWADKKGTEGIQQYWRDKNQTSMDGLQSHILKKNGVS